MFHAVTVDLAGATARVVHSANDATKGASTSAMRARARSMPRWLTGARCIGPATVAIYVCSRENAPPNKAAEQEKRATGHAETDMPPQIVPETALVGTERVEMLHFVRHSRISVDLSTQQARRLIHAARDAFADIAAEALLNLRTETVCAEETSPLDEGEMSATELAIAYAETHPDHLVVIVSSDTDVYGVALAKWARTRHLAGRLFFYDCGLKPEPDTPLGTPGRCFADLGALAASLPDARSARARLLEWIAGGTDYVPQTIRSVEQDHEDVFMLWFDATDDERIDYFERRARKSKLDGIDGATYVAMCEWMYDYYAACTSADIPPLVMRGWHQPTPGGPWLPGLFPPGSNPQATHPAFRAKRPRTIQIAK